jgi:hypothetical protein
VWETNRKTVAKVFQYQKNYYMELRCYQRLKRHSISHIRQFAVPRLIEFDSNLFVLEMSIVTAPYLIDFGKAYLDSEPDHSAETWAEHHQEQQEIWEDRYGEVQAVLWSLRQLGIFGMRNRETSCFHRDRRRVFSVRVVRWRNGCQLRFNSEMLKRHRTTRWNPYQR